MLCGLCLSVFVESEGLSLRVWWVIIVDWIMDGSGGFCSHGLKVSAMNFHWFFYGLFLSRAFLSREFSLVAT